jgi:hypothetical protein
MDGTLIDNIPPQITGFPENPDKFSTTPVARPGLRDILAFAFANYKRVSIWTAASINWYKKVYENVLRPALPLGKDFHFVKTRSPGPYIPLKSLTEIYAEYSDYKPENTIIVDDNGLTFANNIANAEQIPSFFYDRLGLTVEERRSRAAEDVELYALIERLKMRKRENQQKLISCLLSLFGKITSGMTVLSVSLADLCENIEDIINRITEIFQIVCPSVCICIDHEATMHITWVSEDMHPIVFDKIVFPEFAPYGICKEELEF